MQLEHSFTVPVSIDEAWKLLLDIERIGPCLPGAKIASVDGDEFTGTVKVKLGPLNLAYEGKASFVEKDEAARRAVIDARGADARGNGTAVATVTATLTEEGERTTVLVNTDLDITGKPAQFGRGVMVDVGNKLLGQFATALAATIRGDAPELAAPPSAKRNRPKAASPTPTAEEQVADPTPSTDPTPSYSVPGGVPAEAPAPDVANEPAVARVNGHPATPESADVEPLELIKSAGPALSKRLAGPAAVALVIGLLAARRRQKRR